MNISFDFDGTLTDPKIRQLALSLTLSKTNEVFILTSRYSDYSKDVLWCAETIGIKPDHCYFTNGKDKGDFLIDNKLKFDIHFDDDFFEVDSINRKTDTISILVGFELHPLNNEAGSSPDVEPKPTEVKECVWKKDESGSGSIYYETSCKQAHEFTNDGIEENCFIYCPYCGRKIEVENDN